MSSTFPSILTIYEQSSLPRFQPIAIALNNWREMNIDEPEENFWIYIHSMIQMTDEEHVAFEDDILRKLLNKSTRIALKRKLSEALDPFPTVDGIVGAMFPDIRAIVYEGINTEVKGIPIDHRLVLESILHRALEALEAALQLHTKRLCDSTLVLGSFFESVILLRYLHKHPTYIDDFKSHAIIRRYETSKKYFDIYLAKGTIDQTQYDSVMKERLVSLAEFSIELDTDGSVRTKTQRYDWDKMARDVMEKDHVFEAQAHMRFLELMEERNDVAHTRWRCLSAFVKKDGDHLSNSWTLHNNYSMSTYTLLVLHEFFIALRILRPYISELLPFYSLSLWKHYDTTLRVETFSG